MSRLAIVITFMAARAAVGMVVLGLIGNAYIDSYRQNNPFESVNEDAIVQIVGMGALAGAVVGFVIGVVVAGLKSNR